MAHGHFQYFLVFFFAGILLAGCSSSGRYSETSNYVPAESYFEHDLEFQEKVLEDLDARANFSKVVYPADLEGTDQTKENAKVVFYQGIPYYRYWQLQDTLAYVFHPMMFGMTMSLQDSLLAASGEFRSKIKEVAYELPNDGGMAFYYPENYPLNRMVGPDITYSAISQGQILSGFEHLARIDSSYEQELAESLDALLFDYYQGGVNLADKALLEIPLFRSAPEIILNGWLHALIHLNDYVSLHPEDERPKQILLSNLQFLTEQVDQWWNDSLHISMYSDMTSYRGKLTFPDLDDRLADHISVRYHSQIPDFKDQLVTLDPTDTSKFGVYDNHLHAVSQNQAKMRFNLSQFFDTWIVASEPFELTIDCGKYSPYGTRPINGGEIITLYSSTVPDKGLHTLDMNAVKDRFFAGYPCNFIKKGKNFYHVYHIVALIYLGLHADAAPEEIRQLLLQKGEEWYLKTMDYSTDDLDINAFVSTQKILSGINKGKAIVYEKDASTLFKNAGIEEAWQQEKSEKKR